MAIMNFEESDPRSFRIKTDSGTIYTLSIPDDDGFRDVTRFSPGGSQGTFIMRRIDVEKDKEEQEDDSQFRGKILCEVMVGAPMILGIGEGQERIISDTVTEIVDTTR